MSREQASVPTAPVATGTTGGNSPDAAAAPTWLRRIARLAVTLGVAVIIGRSAGALMHREERRPEPAGLLRGILHGVCMPLATPTLLLGHDAPIYASVNTGRTYKVGYTLGVNLCGLVFFGALFAKAAKLRKGVARG